MESALPCRKRDAGGADDLVDAHETLAVCGEEALGAGRVELRQPLAKPKAAQKPMKIESLLSDCLGYFGNGCETSLQCTDVKAGAAHKNRQPPRSCRHRDLVKRQRAPVSD